MSTAVMNVPKYRPWSVVTGAISSDDDSKTLGWRGGTSLPKKNNRTWPAEGMAHTSLVAASWPAWERPAYCIVASALTTSAYEVALQQLQAIQSAGLRTSIETGIAAVSAELSAVYALDEQGHNRLASQKIMILIESKLRNNALFDANRVLTDADVSKLSSRSVMGLIRSTFRFKAQLPAWDRTYSKSWQRVRDSGKSPEALFIGLPRAEEAKVATAAK